MKNNKIIDFNNFKQYIENKTAILLILPSILGCFIFIVIPIIASFFLSFTNWNLLSKPVFVGIFNYQELLTSSIFWQILYNTIIFGMATTVLGTLIPLILASILNNKIRGSELFKTIYFLPFITPMIVIAMVWEWIFNPTSGLLNYILKTNIEWLQNPKTAMIALIIVSVWKLIGYNLVIFISGFASISNTLYEAAKIDGADEYKLFSKITVPLLSPTIFFVLLVTTISSFQIFDLIYLMTQGGPENSTNVLVYWLYRNAFEYFNVGKASAIAYILLIFIIILTSLQWKTRKLWVINE